MSYVPAFGIEIHANAFVSPVRVEASTVHGREETIDYTFLNFRFLFGE